MEKGKEKFKSVIVAIILTFILSLTLPYYKVVSAAEGNTEIKFRINGGTGGAVKAGSTVEITVDLSNLTNFYAGSVAYTYDNTLLEVSSIEVDSKIKGYNIWPAYNDVAKNGNVARYGFTIMGDENGISGSTRFITIKGKAKKDGNLSISKGDVTFQIVQKINGEIKEVKDVVFNNGVEQAGATSEEVSGGSGSTQDSEVTDSSESSNSQAEGGNSSDESSSNGTSSDGTSDNENADNGTSNDDKAGDSSNIESGSPQENGSETVQGSDSLEKSFDENVSDNNGDTDGSEDTSNVDSNGNSYTYISLTLGSIVLATGGTFAYKKRKKQG